MENQGNENHVEIETDEIPDEFQCCVCLELLYKPVVIGCGHIACFWCVFKAMNSLQESSCPICRHPYHHLPAVCRLMHFLLLELYPLVYKTREMQLAEEEKVLGFISPEFDDYASETCCKELGVRDPTSPPHSIIGLQRSDFATEGETSLVNDLSKNSKCGNEIMEQNPKQELMTDLKCGICKQLLCLPVVLNCGHVYCGECVFSQCDKLCRCPVCQMEHPNGYPNTCLVLEHFLEEQFPEEYMARKRTSLNKSDSETASTSTCQTKLKKASHSSSAPIHDYWAWLSGKGPMVHYGIGCDYCGMYPIVGDRYKCKDCKEAIGFDLCEACYSSSSNLPGRFNQQHTPDHRFELLQPVQIRNLILLRDPQQSADGPVFAYVGDSIELDSVPFDPMENTAGSMDNGEDTIPYLDAPGNNAAGAPSQNDNREDPNSTSDHTMDSA
ncbi:PREDICTED: E3 ubiquitin-protein ligase PRT1-like [Ipomoea nil]|uniref:E3 ubiquitin-protein ligase PRT1-like n=1 Tax=Ipomoea nil TaxID=35883 RepID=UPI000900DF3D|nr:PREDICTED: E3 ubiquitin-protein ligase PRT1-like [Ipomoea nil]